MNLALLGPGKIADRFLIPALERVDGVQLWSVMSRDADRARDFAAKHRAASPQPAYTDLRELLADTDVDAVLIATPDGLHAEQAVACAESGRHILVEKPMATDREGARAMVDAARANSVRLGIAYHLRWHAGHRKLAAMIHAGEFGTLRHMRAQWTFRSPDDSNWRASADVGRWWALAGVGTHCLDLVRWFMVPGCGEVVEVKSLIARDVWKGPNDETSVVLLRFKSGATAEITVSALFNSEPVVEVHGTEGDAVCRGTLGPSGAGSIQVGDAPLAFDTVDPYAGEISDFAAAVRDGRDPEVAGEEGASNVDILLQADPR